MRNVNKFIHLAVTLTFLLFPGQVLATSLLEVYQQALQSDPLIHEAEARRLATLEALPQARGLLLPQLNVDNLSAKKIDQIFQMVL